MKADATGANDGSSWTNAFTKLQDALFQACPNITQIWVAKGTYYPDEGGGKINNDRLAYFTMKNNLAIYGGFNGTESQLSERNFATNETILSGDIDQNDAANFTNNSGNSYHVVANYDTSLTHTAILDGFTITGGNANYSGNDPSLALNKNGGGIINMSSSPVINNCKFLGNSSINLGGGAYNDSAQVNFNNCTFTTNSAAMNGGAVYNTSTVFYTDVNFYNCSFFTNTAAGDGGGIYNDYLISTKVVNSKFVLNVHDAIDNGSSTSLNIINTIFSRNTGSPIVNGIVPTGGVVVGGATGSSAVITNCSFSQNEASVVNNSGNMYVYNSISDKPITDNSGSVHDFIIKNSDALAIDLSKNNYSNIGANPLFVDPVHDNLRLQAGSPAIDKGDNVYNSELFDLDGNPRKFGVIDMGAYEYGSGNCPVSGILYVNKNAGGLNNGSTWGNAYVSLQDALSNKCPNVTQIWVAKGTYYPDEGVGNTDNDRSASFIMKNGVAIYGGFTGTETSLNARNWNLNKTILSGDIDQNDDAAIATSSLLTNASRANNSYHVIMNNYTADNLLTNTAILDGFVISGGNANAGAEPNSSGGGMSNVYASPIIKNCIFSNNAANGGGGLYNSYSEANIIQCIFKNNQAGNLGGGIDNFNSAAGLKITNSTFNGNASSTGGGIGNAFATPTITNCIIYGNTGALPGISDQSEVSTVTYSIVQYINGSQPGIGNLNVDPKFIDAVNGDLHLQATSPAINAGLSSANNESVDFDGNSRNVGNIDMGVYEYHNLAQATTTTIASSNNPACYNANITFFGTVLSGSNPVTTGTVTFTEGATTLASSVVLNASGQASFSTNTLNVGSHTILATYNPAAGFNASRASINQTVNVLPTASISGNASFCSGGSTVLSANATAGSGTIASYQWKVDGNNISNATNAAYNATAAGNYAVVVTNSNGCSTTSTSFAVAVNALPTAIINGNTSFCQGGSTVLSSNPPGGNDNITSYQWKVNSNIIPGETNPTFTASTAGIYSVVITTINNCSTTSADFAVAENALPTASISAMLHSVPVEVHF